MSAPDLVLTAAALAAGLLLLSQVLHLRFGHGATAVVLALTALGTLLTDVAARARAADAAAFALGAAALWLRARSGGGAAARAGAIGAVAGLAAALHWPNAALAVLAVPAAAPRTRAVLAAGAAGVAAWGLAAAFGPAAPVLAGPPEPLLVLFGSRQGLLFLTPVLGLGVLGLAAEARRAPAVTAAAVVLLAWHALWPPRVVAPREALAAVLPLLAPGLGAVLHRLRAAVRSAPSGPLWAAGLALVCWNLLFMQQYAADMIPRDAPVSFPQVARNGAALVARAVGTPSAWPANWLFAARYATGPERFDAAAGKRLPRGAGGAVTLDVGRLDQDDALLLEGWSVRHPCGAALCRAVEGTARLLLPVDARAESDLVVHASGQGTLSVAGGRGAALARMLGPAPADLVFDLGPLPAGLHALSLTVPPGGRALVDRLTLRPRAEGRR